MERVVIIGCNGAGKTTFAFHLAEKTGLSLTHIDQLYWRGSWEVTPKETFEQLVLEQANQPRWIIEGNNLASLPTRLARADTVFWFEFSPLRCVCNILKREWTYRGRTRPDLPPTCISRPSLSFLRAAWQFRRKNHDRIAACLSEARPHATVIHFTTPRQVRRFCQTL